MQQKNRQFESKNKKKLDYKQLKISGDYRYSSDEEQEEQEEQKKQEEKQLIWMNILNG